MSEQDQNKTGTPGSAPAKSQGNTQSNPKGGRSGAGSKAASGAGSRRGASSGPRSGGRLAATGTGLESRAMGCSRQDASRDPFQSDTWRPGNDAFSSARRVWPD